MNIFSVLGKIRVILGKITDFLIAGREKGLWDENNSVPGSSKVKKGK